MKNITVGSWSVGAKRTPVPSPLITPENKIKKTTKKSKFHINTNFEEKKK